MPTCLAALITSVPGAACHRLAVDREIYKISHFCVTYAITSSDACSYGHGLPFKMRFELVAELLDDRDGRHRRRIAQRAERPAQHVLRNSPIRSMSLVRPAAVVEAVEHLLQPGGAFAAGDAPAAAFVRVEPHDAQRGLHHAGVFVQDHHAARTQHALRPSPANRKSMATSHSSAFSTGQDDPPGTTAFNFLPLRMPPPTSSIMRSRLKPIGSS